MAQKALGERVDDLSKGYGELDKLVAVLVEQMKTVSRSLDALNLGQNEAKVLHTNLQLNFEREAAVFKQQLDELRRWTEKNSIAEVRIELTLLKEKLSKLEAAQEKASNRAWSVVPNVIGAIVSGIIAALVAYFVSKR